VSRAEGTLLPLDLVSPIVPPSSLISPAPSLQVIAVVSSMGSLVSATIVATDEGWESAVELPTRGAPVDEPPLPVARCVVRTVDGVAGERPLPPCGARGVVLAPLSTLTCLARGVVS
jgi:hypothetical protein